MSKLTPLSWKDFVKRFKKFKFNGPYQEGKHPYMIKDDIVVTIPNPHDKDISVDLISRILRQAGIPRDDWVNQR